MTKSLSTSFDSFFERIKEILQGARNKVYRTANIEMLQAYWNVGREIVEEEQNGKDRAEYGNYLIKNLSAKLTQAFGKGFTKSNLHYMRQFYQTFEKVHALRGELSWTHYRLLVKVEKENVREFYVRFFKDKIKQPGDNPTIGLILCTDKNKTIVKYSVLNEGKQIFASKYKLYLPNEESLKEEIRRERDFLEREQSLREG